MNWGELKLSRDYNSLKLVNLLKNIGYKHRVGNYYLFREKDGYINVNYWKTNNIEYIEFHKNFTTPQYPEPSTINKIFGDYSDFVRFMSKYHKKEMRLIKLNELDD